MGHVLLVGTWPSRSCIKDYVKHGRVPLPLPRSIVCPSALSLRGWRPSCVAPFGCSSLVRARPRDDGHAFPGRRECRACVESSTASRSFEAGWMVSRWGVALFSAPPPVPFFPEVHEELTRSWKAPFTARNKSCSSSALTTLDGGAALGYVGIPSVEQSVAMQLCPTAAITLRDYPCLPSRACKYSSGLTGSAYRACGEATSALHAVALLQVHQAKALKDLHEGGHDLVVLHELHAATDLALRPTKVTAQSLGKSTLVVQECHLWLCLADMKEHEKVQYMLPCRRPASLAMLSKALPSSSRQHRSRLRQSCAGGNLLLPIRLHPLSLLVAMGAPLWPPPLSSSRSSLPPGSIMEPVSGRIPSPSRLPPTRWNQVSVTFYNQTPPLPSQARPSQAPGRVPVFHHAALLRVRRWPRWFRWHGLSEPG